MIMDPQELEELSEDELRKTVIIPLLKGLGYRDVFEWHGGPGELGKDIVAWKENELGSRRNIAVVAKAKRISSNADMNEVATQVRQAFGAPYDDPRSGLQQSVAECWVITNKVAGKDARKRLRATLYDIKESDLEILDRDQLFEKFKKHVPSHIHEHTEIIHKQLGHLDHKVAVQIGDSRNAVLIVTNGEKSFYIGEKHPGHVEPIEINASIGFPDSPEGQQKLKEFETVVGFGGNVKIPGEYVNLSLPDRLTDLIQSLTGWVPTEFTEVTVARSGEPQLVPVRIEITNDDSDKASLEYIELRFVEGDGDRLLFSNENQPFPIKIEIEFNQALKRVSFNTKLAGGPIAAPRLKEYYDFLTSMAKPGDITISRVDTSGSIGIMRAGQMDRVILDEADIDLANLLAEVQRRTGVPILIPRRSFTESDLESFELLRIAFEVGAVDGTWNDITFTVLPDAVEENFELISKQEAFAIRVEQEEWIQLFETWIPLGRARYSMGSARLSNEDEVRDWLAHAISVSEPVEFKLVPANDNRRTIEYLDWQ